MLLLRRTTSLEARTQRFLSAIKDGQEAPEVTCRNYEEIIESCQLVADETVSSIENWTDIVPEANIGTQVGLIVELRGSVTEKAAELAELQKALEESQGKSQQDTAELRNHIRAKEEQIAKLERDIWERKKETGIAALVRSGAFSEAASTGGLPPRPKLGLMGALMAGDSGSPMPTLTRPVVRPSSSEAGS
jgi:hypothetical protein